MQPLLRAIHISLGCVFRLDSRSALKTKVRRRWHEQKFDRPVKWKKNQKVTKPLEMHLSRSERNKYGIKRVFSFFIRRDIIKPKFIFSCRQAHNYAKKVIFWKKWDFFQTVRKIWIFGFEKNCSKLDHLGYRAFVCHYIRCPFFSLFFSTLNFARIIGAGGPCTWSAGVSNKWDTAITYFSVFVRSIWKTDSRKYWKILKISKKTFFGEKNFREPIFSEQKWSKTHWEHLWTSQSMLDHV